MNYVECSNCGKYTDDGVLINDNGKRVRLCVECSTAYEEQEENNMVNYNRTYVSDLTSEEQRLASKAKYFTYNIRCKLKEYDEVLDEFYNLIMAKAEAKNPHIDWDIAEQATFNLVANDREEILASVMYNVLDIEENIISEIETGEYNEEQFNLFLDNLGWEDWMNDYTDKNEDEEITEEECQNIDTFLKAIWDNYFK